MTEQESSVPETDTLAFVDKAGALCTHSPTNAPRMDRIAGQSYTRRSGRLPFQPLITAPEDAPPRLSFNIPNPAQAAQLASQTSTAKP